MPGQRAVVLLNRNTSPASITVNWSDLGLATGPAQVRDLWAHADPGQSLQQLHGLCRSTWRCHAQD